MWEDQNSTAGSQHLVNKGSVDLASEEIKHGTYTSKMNLVTVKAHPRIDTGEK
jgi:hypothetical protein